jgi:general secretion pathway protein G
MVYRTINDNRGFTLIELMVVVIILGILALYVGPKIMGEPEKAKRVKAKMDIATFETALKMYKLDNGVYPSTEQGLAALVEKPETGSIPKKWREGGYLEKRKVPKDPWGTEFVYSEDDQDINNWDIE